MNRKRVMRTLVRTIVDDTDGGGAAASPTGETSSVVEADGAEGPSEPSGEEGAEEGVSALGDAGKQALDRMKAKWRAERDRRKQLEAKYEPPTPPDETVTAAVNKKILRAEIKAAAAGQFKDPADVYRFLDLEQFEVSEAGDVNDEEIAEAISALLFKKPYLGVTQGERRYKGSADGGVRQKSAPGQLTKADLANMSPQAILQADRQGRLNRIKGLK